MARAHGIGPFVDAEFPGNLDPDGEILTLTRPEPSGGPAQASRAP
jgi:hypothetical protein